MQDIYQGNKRRQSKYVADHIDINPNQAMTASSAATEGMPDEQAQSAPR